ncbi:hypothetical protein [Devosia sediminis]|uniref:Integrase n=1 Tax=Devosia sediminis TaxID=2798801 RepID=A0A934MGQ0_9HYPH|nr:hypothetical protein [Devosia sediminis]MBJ3784187.1 hypothetical protein [Devosia sediminis]
MNVIILPSARERDADANLSAFVAKGRASKAFGVVDFDADVWCDVQLSKAKRITAGNTGPKQLHFLVGTGARGAEDKGALAKPLNDFVKALLRLREEARPQHIENHRVMLRAVRHLHAIMEELNYDPCRLLPRHFDAAARRAVAMETPSTAYATGKFLAEIVGWINQHGVGRIRIEWRNVIPRPSNDDRISEDAAKRRTDKMPSPAALEALPKIAQLMNSTTLPADLIRMRTVELLVCGGWRINELLTIPADCEVEEGNVGDEDYRYGIRYFAEKGYGPDIKWISTPLISVAKRAISDIRRLTQDVREDAKFIFENPGKHPMPVLQGDADELIQVADMAAAFNTTGPIMTGICKTRQVNLPARGKIRRGDLACALLADVPVVPAAFPLKLHQFMFLIRENEMHARRGAVPGTVRTVVWEMISDFITGAEGVQNVFQRYGFSEPDGTLITVKSHAFRHWLNTLAQEGGMSQELIARWSGRKDMNQNSFYDHVSGADLAKKVRGMIESGGLIGQVAKVRETLPPIERDAFLATQISTGHVTDIGICAHDWQLAPCPVHGDCATCGEHIIDKNNADQRAAAERQLEQVESMLAIAEAEAVDGTLGAPRWVEAHRRKRIGLLEVIAVHNDIAIADGTFVHLGSKGSDGR